MISDAREVPEGTRLEADVVVIGAGAAGITVARALDHAGFDVALLESGGLEFDEETTALAAVESTGVPYEVAATRLRWFGGTTNHWTGWTRPLDPIDFERRDWIPNSGWPFGPEALAPWYPEAQRVATGLEPLPTDWRWWVDEAGDARVVPVHDGETVTGTIWRISPVRFGDEYRGELERSERVATWLHANVTEIRTTPDGSRFEAVDVATLAGNRFEVASRVCVLATGGIENARVLLASRSTHTEGLGNGHDLVGRYFADHLEPPVGTLVLTAPPSGAYGSFGAEASKAGLAFTPDAQARLGLGNSAFVLEPWPVEGDAAVRGGGGGLPPEADLDTIPAEAMADVMRALHGGGTVPYLLKAHAEPEPDPESRVVLTAERDALTVPRAELRWRVARDVRERLAREVRALGAELGFQGVGIARLDATVLLADESAALWSGAHHMGTTRMHGDPTRGVVDADGRLHEVAGVYVAGSSVFPAFGHANPTLTIVALALRLADHLRARLV